MLKAALIYTAARIAIFAVLLALLWALDLGSYPGILFALLLSMPAAFFLLVKQRADLAEAMLKRREARNAVRARMRGNSDGQTDREQHTEEKLGQSGVTQGRQQGQTASPAEHQADRRQGKDGGGEREGGERPVAG